MKKLIFILLALIILASCSPAPYSPVGYQKKKLTKKEERCAGRFYANRYKRAY